MTDIVQKTVGSNDLYVIDGSNNTLVVDQTNGRVGINNTNPGYSLTVTGATHTTANLSAGTNLFLVDEANSRISIGTTTGVSGFVLNVSGNTTLVGTLKLGSNLTHYNNTAPAAGQLLIGDATAGVWDAATLTAGTNVTITNADGAITIAAAGGGGGAPTDAQYVVLTGDATLTDERVLTAGTAISLTDAGAGSTITVANTGVTSNVAGAGIGVSGATGAVTVTNAGVTAVSAAPSPTNVVVTGATGNVGFDILNRTTPIVGGPPGVIDSLIDVGLGPQPINQIAWVMFEETTLGLGPCYIPIYQP